MDATGSGSGTDSGGGWTWKPKMTVGVGGFDWLRSRGCGAVAWHANSFLLRMEHGYVQSSCNRDSLSWGRSFLVPFPASEVMSPVSHASPKPALGPLEIYAVDPDPLQMYFYRHPCNLKLPRLRR